jgi:L-ascorbate metabolism protein UlaG (beta-lactamase superfamily)
MRIRWYGQSAFLFTGEQRHVFIDPFGDMSGLTDRGIEWRYPPIEGVEADLLLVTHDHLDHNAVDVIGGEPAVIDEPGTHESPVGKVVGIASEHDQAAGTERGANTIFCFSLDGLRVAHLGDFGQTALRPEQRAAIGEVDALLIPVGGAPTIPAADAAALVRELGPRLVVPMHYRTEQVGFLDPPDAFLEALGADIERVPESELAAEDILGDGVTVGLLAPPRA